MKTAPLSAGFAFLTRKQISSVFKIPKPVVDQWIATGQISSMRISVLGRGGQRIFYSAADAQNLVRARKPRKRKVARRV